MNWKARQRRQCLENSKQNSPITQLDNLTIGKTYRFAYKEFNRQNYDLQEGILKTLDSNKAFFVNPQMPYKRLIVTRGELICGDVLVTEKIREDT